MNPILKSRVPLIAIAFACLLPLRAAAADDYASRWDAFTAFSYFESGSVNLAERGYHIQVGYNPKRWYAIGFDYSNVNGTLNLIPAYLPAPLQAKLAPLFALLPPTYKPAVPTDTNTQTFALGPTIVIRHFKHFGILLHPSLGAVREFATPKPNDAITTAAVGIFFTGAHKLDWQGFYGIGGGIDVPFNKYFGIRMHTDLVYDHLIDDVIGKGRWTVRASIGPSFHFGKNIPR